MKNLSEIHKLRNWKHTLDKLSEETGTSLKDAADYIGAAYNESGVSFYVKLPRKRSVYIGLGMAFRQPVDVINRWITEYAGKRRLYVKDISEDLVWIYLINANIEDSVSGTNYFRRYDEYQSVAYSVFSERWDEIVLRYEETADVEITLGQADYGPEYDGIKAFVAEHLDAFKTAYSKPRKYLDLYVGSIVETCRRNPANHTIKSLNSLRGFLDDSMINFLSGNSETINVTDRRTGKRTINIKHVPKGRRKYIDLCLSLGMTTEDLNEFLSLMGYAPLDLLDRTESELIKKLTDWEYAHPEQRAFKNKYIRGDSSVVLTESEEFKAAEDMLQLNNDLGRE